MNYSHHKNSLQRNHMVVQHLQSKNLDSSTAVTDKSIVAIPGTAKPAKCVHFLDPDFGTCVAHVSENANDSNTIANRIAPDYSRRKAFRVSSEMRHTIII